MQESYDLVVRGGLCVSHRGIEAADIGIRDGRIVAIGTLSADGANEIDARALHVLPGVIDTQVHFREPGLEHKEDLETGSRAAVLGGVTAVFEMPNTSPATVNAELLSDKLARARARMYCDHAFFVGATRENVDELAMLEHLPGCCGVKVFMGSSTGTLLVEDEATLLRLLERGSRRVAVHCEDETRLRERKAQLGQDAWVGLHPVWRDDITAFVATERLLRLAKRTRRRVHVLHVTTAKEMALLGQHKDIATVECTPQHLTLVAPDCYDQLGTLAQMNPPIRGELHREALWRAVKEGVVDVLGSDHAPHTLDEKARTYPTSPAGMPGVQTLLPIMLEHVHAGRMSLEHLVDLTSAGPARVFGIAGKGRIGVGCDADLTLVDLAAERVIKREWIASRCGWTPFEGHRVHGWPMITIVRGHVVMRDDEIVGDPVGQPVRFWECLPA